MSDSSFIIHFYSTVLPTSRGVESLSYHHPEHSHITVSREPLRKPPLKKADKERELLSAVVNSIPSSKSDASLEEIYVSHEIDVIR